MATLTPKLKCHLAKKKTLLVDLFFLFLVMTTLLVEARAFLYNSRHGISIPTQTRNHILPRRIAYPRKHPSQNIPLPPLSSVSSSFSSLISPTDAWGNWAVLLSTASLSQLIGKSTRIGRLLGPPVTAMALTFLLASVQVLPPGGTAASKSLQLLSLQLATPLLLLGANVRDCYSKCGPLLEAFFYAALSTTIACVVGYKVCGAMLQKALQSDGLKIAAALLAKNIGGGINYLAVCRSLEASPNSVAAGLCVDNIFALLYFPATSALAAGRPDVEEEETISISTSTLETKIQNSNQEFNNGNTTFVSNTTTTDATTTTNNLSLDLEQRPTTIPQASTALSIAALATWCGERIGGTSGALPLSTLLTVLLASVLPRSFLEPLQPAAHVLGTCGLYIFFATAGAPGLSVAESVKASLVPIGLFLTLLYSIHGACLWACHCVMGQHSRRHKQQRPAACAPQRLLVASSAAIGGPATAAALAQAHGWHRLVVPSLLVGNLGYAVATFLGISYYKIFL